MKTNPSTPTARGGGEVSREYIAGVEGMREAVLEAIKEEMEDGEPGHPWNAALETVHAKIESLKPPPPREEE